MGSPDQSGVQASPSAATTGVQGTKKTMSVAIGTLLGLILGAFLLGLVPMWVTAYARGSELATLTERHEDIELELALARAAVLARHGDYEAARGAASEFFTGLNRQVIAAGENGHTSADVLRAWLTDRDEIITLLARSDPAAGDKLAALYMSYRSLHVSMQQMQR